MRQHRLEQRLENDEPKCKNCQYWRQKGFNAGSAEEPTIEMLPFGKCHKYEWQVVTTDLTVCSKWEAKE